jgi:hypothetical protein
MRTIPLVDHNVPLPTKTMTVIHLCEPEPSEPIMVVRKFRSRCGNTIEVHITRKSGFIRSIKPLDICRDRCADCRERIELIHELIRNEYKLA